MFQFDEKTREFSNLPYPIAITPGNVITSVEVSETEFGVKFLDITIENPANGYKMRERIFEIGDIPEWTTLDKEVGKLKGKIKHIMARFVPEEEQIFTAGSFKEIAAVVKGLLDKYAVETQTPFSVITVWDNNFAFPILRKYPPFMATENDPPLAYSETEKKRNFTEEETTE